MKRITNPVVKVFEQALVLVMAALVVDVVWQVFTRYVLGHQSPWTEELATMLLMWGALLGACVAFSRDAHLGLDYFVKKLDVPSQRAVKTYVLAVNILFGVILTGGGYQLVAGTLATNQVSPALAVKMGYVYLALPLSGLFILLLACERLLASSGDDRSHR